MQARQAGSLAMLGRRGNSLGENPLTVSASRPNATLKTDHQVGFLLSDQRFFTGRIHPESLAGCNVTRLAGHYPVAKGLVISCMAKPEQSECLGFCFDMASIGFSPLIYPPA